MPHLVAVIKLDKTWLKPLDGPHTSSPVEPRAGTGDLLIVAVLLLLAVLLSGLLLGLLLLVLLANVARERLLKNLQHLLVGDLLVSLVLAHIKSRWTSELLKAVLGDG